VPDTDLDDIRTLWRRPGYDLDRNSVLVVARRGRGADLRPEADARAVHRLVEDAFADSGGRHH
jgi:hypothetical protein